MRPILFSLFFSFALIFLSVTYVNAQAEGLIPCSGPDCQACHLASLGQNILTWFIGIMSSVIALVFAIGGFKMVTSGGDSGAVSSAKTMMTNSIIGFIILLSGWLVINTVILTFADGASTSGTWFKIACVAQPEQSTTPTTLPDACVDKPNPEICACEARGGVWLFNNGGSCQATADASTLSHERALAQLSGMQVVSSGKCTDRSDRRCTSLDGVQQSTLDTVKSVAQSCSGCNLVITGGTEVGHTNQCHAQGTCLDIKCANGCSDAQVLSVHTTAQRNGARVVYETLRCSDRDRARAAGLTAYCKSDKGYGHITGDHFSLYTGK